MIQFQNKLKQSRELAENIIHLERVDFFDDCSLSHMIDGEREFYNFHSPERILEMHKEIERLEGLCRLAYNGTVRLAKETV